LQTCSAHRLQAYVPTASRIGSTPSDKPVAIEPSCLSLRQVNSVPDLS